MPEIRTCIVSYTDLEGTCHRVEATAQTLYEAAVLGMNAMRVPDWLNAASLKIDVTVKTPEVTHTIWNSVLAAWLSRTGRSPKEQALKARLQELIRSQ